MVAALVALFGVGLVFGLNKEPIAEIGFCGVVDAAGEGEFSAFLRPRSAGEAEAVPAAVGEGLASDFFRARCLAGDADAVLSAAGEALVPAFFCARCFAGEGDVLGEPLGVGD